MVIKEKYIYRYDDVINPIMCNKIVAYYNNTIKDPVEYDVGKMPWFENDAMYLSAIINTAISNEIYKCRTAITELVNKAYEEILYPHLTTLVMWRKGRHMPMHKDNGYEHDKDVFSMRKYTAVLYLNDNYTGGETVILKENSAEIEYTSVPRKGSVVILKSDDSCIHGVNPILKGNRLALSMWFTYDIKYIEHDSTELTETINKTK